MVHPADIFVGDLSGEFQFILESLDGLFFSGNLGKNELERDPFFDFRIKDLIDPAHSSGTEILDDLIAIGENRARRKRLERFGESHSGRFIKLDGGIDAGSALPAIAGIFRIVKMALGTFHDFYLDYYL
jgi:hypothetical protein